MFLLYSTALRQKNKKLKMNAGYKIMKEENMYRSNCIRTNGVIKIAPYGRACISIVRASTAQ